MPDSNNNPLARPADPNIRGRVAPTGPIPQVTLNFLGSNPPPTPFSAPSAAPLNAVGTTAQQRQQQIAAENALLRVLYGRVAIGAQIADVLFYNGSLVIIAVWGHGPMNAIEQVYLDDKVPAAGVVVTSYTGTQVAADSTLVAAYAAQSPTVAYADVLSGIAYSVIVLPPGVTTGFPRISAIVQGLKVYDPRTTLTAYSDNPALALADLEVNTVYGAAGSVDWTTVTTVASACDALVGGTEKRRTIGLVIDQAQTIEAWREVMRAYAGCFCARTGATLVLIPDRPASSVYTFNETAASGAAGNCRVKNVKRRSRRDVPTVVAVRYTDTSVYPWRDNIAYAYAAGVQTGSVPWKPREVAMPGITRSTQATREAIEQLNKLTLADLVCEVEAADEALTVTIGDVVTVTANLGISGQLMRVVPMRTPSLGRPIFSLERYDPTVYSDSVASGSVVIDTSLPNPNALTPPTSLVITETVYLERVNGSSLAGGLIYQSRFDCSWTAPPLQYPIMYRVELWDGSTKIRDEQCAATTYSSPAVQQGKTYALKVFSRNSAVECATPLIGSQTAQGKLLPPGPVPSITRAVELGGRVLLSWTPAPDIDVIRYEWRYFPNGTGSWASATFIDRVDGLSTAFQGLPVGTHRFYVRAIDSVGNYSTGDCFVDITVTSDANSFTQSFTVTSPTLVNMAAAPVVEGIGALRWITSVTGDQWGTVEPNPLSSGANPVASYHASGTQTWTGNAWDLGTSLSGSWSLAAVVTVITGAVAFYIETSPDGSTWTRQPGISWQGTTRFARAVMEALTASTIRVESPPVITLSALSRTESGVVTTSASVATLVQLTGQYASAADLQVTPANTTAARDAVWDRLLVHHETGLMLTYDFNGSGDNLEQRRISTASRVIASGDFLEYDVFIDSSSPVTTSFAYGGMLIDFTDATSSGGAPCADGFALNAPGTSFDSSARGKWASRKCSFTGFVGKTTNSFALTQEGDAVSGTAKVLYRNVRITDGAGTTRLTIWTSGEPTANTDRAASLVTNTRCGPSNSFNVYAFNPATGAQAANDVRWAFKGI